VIRITENNPLIKSNSPALTRLFELTLEAFHKSGNILTPNEAGMTDELAGMMHRYGMKQVQTRVHLFNYQAGTVEGQLLYEDMKHFFHLMPHYLRKWIRVPDDYQDARFSRSLR
jgi:hypothetical protein